MAKTLKRNETFERYTLVGFYSHRELSGKLVVSFDPTDTHARNTLSSVCPDGLLPFGGEAFYVVVPERGRARLEAMIQPLLGCRVAVTLYVHRYSFVSQFEINRGEQVRGSRLVLISMKKAW